MEKNYNITCIDRNCGLFSDLVHAIFPSIIYLKDNCIDTYHVEWMNRLYQNDRTNLYNHFFENNNPIENYDKELRMSNCPYGIFFRSHNPHELLKRGYDVIKTLNLFESEYFKTLTLPFGVDEKVLGVQQRKTDHYSDARIIPDDDLIKKVELEYVKNSYDKIFITTDDNDTLTKYKLVCDSNVSTFSLLINYDKDIFEYIDK